MPVSSQTATKVSTSSIVVAVVTAAAGLGLLGMAAGLLPGITQTGYVNLKSSLKADKQSIETEGDFLTYVLTIANTGTKKAENVTALGRLASDTLSFVSAKTGSGMTCSASAATSNAVACTGGTIEAGKTATISIVTKLAKNANKCGTSGTAASVFSVDPANAIAEKDEKDNDATLSTAVPGICAAAALPNFTVTNLAVASSNGLVTATLNNVGAADVTDAVGVYLYVDGATSMTYSSSTLKDVAWLAHGGTSPISTKTVDVATVKTVKMCVDPLGTVAESDETDNCQELALTPPAAEGIDLTVKKSGSVPSAKQGDTVSYTISVTNAGTIPATSVGLTDAYAAPFTYASATGSDGFVCTSAPMTVVCKGATIAAGKTATITVKLTAGSTGLACDTTKVVTDVATVDPLNKIVETNEGNNKATADTTLTNPCSGSSVTPTTTTTTTTSTPSVSTSTPSPTTSGTGSGTTGGGDTTSTPTTSSGPSTSTTGQANNTSSNTLLGGSPTDNAIKF